MIGMESRLSRRKKRKKTSVIQGTILSLLIFVLALLLFIDYQSDKNVASALGDDEVLEKEAEQEKPVTNTSQEPEEIKEITTDVSQIEKDESTSPEAEDQIESSQEETQDQEDDTVVDKEDTDKMSNVQDKKVYITFDDGPSEVTMAILDLLDTYNIKATFFMLEPQMRAFPYATKEIVARGHQVGLHSVTHDKNKFYRSSTSSLNEMLKAQETLKEITGIQSNLVRVPYGSHPLLKPEAARKMEEAGMKIWDWNVDSKDWKYPNGSFVNYTIQQIETFTKDEPIIVLLHDRPTTYYHLEDLLLYFIENGFVMDILQEDMVPVQF